jgi:DNA repair protein RadC
MIAASSQPQQNAHQLALAGTPAPLRKFALAALGVRERPAYRAATQPAGCTTQELLAGVIGGPQQIEIAQALLEKFVTLRTMYNARAEEIATVPGLGQAKAEQIKAALALGLRVTTEVVERQAVNSPSDIAGLVQAEMSLFTEEHLWVILLDTRLRLIEIARVYKGSVNSSQVRVGELFKDAVRVMAHSVAICHNHPSGDPTPSPDDVAVTRALVQAGKLLDIDVLDHIVIGQNSKWVSLKERGLGFG